MKRHEALIPLSHDHHHGLILAQLIKQGAPVYKGLPKKISDKVDFTIRFYKDELAKHFDNEEKILFPVVKGKNYDLDNLVKEIVVEHRLLKKLIHSLNVKKEPGKILNKIGILLEEHIRKEERILFEKIQAVLNETELNNLNGKIKAVKPDECDI